MTSPQAKDFLEAFERVEAEISAVSEVAVVNLDVTSAVATALGALPDISRFRHELADLKDFDVARLDNLRDYGFALLHIQSSCRGAASPVSPLGALAEELLVIRAQLLADAAALGKRKVIDMARVEKYRSGLGFKNLAIDVTGLVQILRDNAEAIVGKTAVTPADLDHAAALAGRLIVDIGSKPQAAPVSALSRLRQQAFTLFTRAYGEVRRAVIYLRRREGDADTIAPSLWAGRGGRKRRELRFNAQTAAAEPSEPADQG